MKTLYYGGIDISKLCMKGELLKNNKEIKMELNIIIIVLIFGLIIISFRKKLLTLNAAVVSTFVGLTILYLGGIECEIVLLLFYISSSLITKFKYKKKKEIEEKIYQSNSCRNVWQVLAVSLPGIVCLVLYNLSKEITFLVCFYSSFAFSCADTWASEIGVLSKRNPILITNFKPINKGISGGISFIGSFASAMGALFISLIFGLFWHELNNYKILMETIFFSGFISCFIDSLLGALFQPLYKENECYTEKNNGELIKGNTLFSNTNINFYSSVISIIVSIIILTIFLY